jgi:hypothetical protein
MTVELDHIVVFCAAGGPEAAALTARGLLDGSGQSHPGQGTANRRFSFRNAYLELLWVEDEAEARSDVVQPTQLWDRWSRRGADASPFGFAFRPKAGATSTLPFPTWSYKPSYLPPNLSIEIGKDLDLREPLLFLLPYLLDGRPAARPGPLQHGVQIDELAALHVFLPGVVTPSPALARLVAAGLLRVSQGPEYLLEIGFNGDRAARLDLRPDLPIVFTPLGKGV